MPFVRVSRDRRGYDHVYLVHSTTRRGRPPETRVLYWYRTPPGVKVGREPFDMEVRQRLEAQYPGIVFEWEKLVVAPPPSPEEERWRERRRIERAFKQARRLEGEAAAAEGRDQLAAADSRAPELAGDEGPELVEDAAALARAETESGSALEPHSETLVPAGPEAEAGPRKKRRRRGGRGRRPAAVAATDALVPEGASVQVVTAREPDEVRSDGSGTEAPAGEPDEPS